MQHYIDLFREQLGSDDMHSTPFLDAAHKIVQELEEWQRKFHSRCDMQLDVFRKVGMTEAAERCAEIAATMWHDLLPNKDIEEYLDSRQVVLNDVAAAIRKEFNLG